MTAETRIDAARALLNRGLAELSVASVDDSRVRELIEVAGELVLADCSLEGVDARLRDATRRAISSVDLTDLGRAADELSRLADDPARPLAADERARIVDALKLRTRHERVRRGAMAILRERLDVEPEVRVFDDAAEAAFFRLVAANDARTEELARIAPRFHDDVWWLSRAVDLPADTEDRLGDVAVLVARFPQARAEFADAVRAEERRNESRGRSSTRRLGAAPTLQAFLDAHERAVTSNEPIELERDDALHLTLKEGQLLLLRVRAPLRPGERPRVRAGVVQMEMTPVAGTRARYEARLDARMRMAPRLTVEVPFAGDDRRIEVLDVLRSR